MAKQIKFRQLDDAAAELDYFDPRRERVNDIISHSEENSSNEDGRIASVIDLLSYEPRADIRAWFAAHGLTA